MQFNLHLILNLCIYEVKVDWKYLRASKLFSKLSAAWEINTRPFYQNLNQFTFQKQSIGRQWSWSAMLLLVIRQPPLLNPCLRLSVMSLNSTGQTAFIISGCWEAGGQESGNDRQWSQGKIHHLKLPDDSASLFFYENYCNFIKPFRDAETRVGQVRHGALSFKKRNDSQDRQPKGT